MIDLMKLMAMISVIVFLIWLAAVMGASAS